MVIVCAWRNITLLLNIIIIWYSTSYLLDIISARSIESGTGINVVECCFALGMWLKDSGSVKQGAGAPSNQVTTQRPISYSLT